MTREKEAAPVDGATVSGRGKRYDKRGFAIIPDSDFNTDAEERQVPTRVFKPPEVPGRIFKCDLLQTIMRSETLPTAESLAAALDCDPDRVRLALFELCRDHPDLDVICVGDVVLLPIVASEQLRHAAGGEG